MLRTMIVAAVVVLCATNPAHGRVHVNLGINLGTPPALVAVPGIPVQYAPNVDANYFYYGGQYYVYANGAWYAAPTYNGPWVVVDPVLVPRPLLSVPILYYRAPPASWRHWRRAAPPHWRPKWGRHWH